MWQKLTQSNKALTWFFWAMACTGFLLPWVTGAAVKLYLRSHGNATLPWEALLDPEELLFEIPLTLFWASPFIVLGLAAKPLLQTEARFLSWSTTPERATILACTFIGGVWGVVRTFLDVFWVFNPLTFFVPLPLYYLGDMGLGLIAGLSLAAISAAARTGGAAGKPPMIGAA